MRHLSQGEESTEVWEPLTTSLARVLQAGVVVSEHCGTAIMKLKDHNVVVKVGLNLHLDEIDTMNDVGCKEYVTATTGNGLHREYLLHFHDLSSGYAPQGALAHPH
jgi:hypothetical protein